MDKIRKTIEWLWRSKERMALAVMVVVLGVRVNQVLHPKEDVDPPVHRIPRTTVPDDPAEREELGFPGPPPPPPPSLVPKVWKPLVGKNPFWYYASPDRVGRGSEETGPGDADIELLLIVERPDGPRAQFRAGNTKEWHNEGDQFQKFELIRIDPDAGECELYSAGLGKRITIMKK